MGNGVGSCLLSASIGLLSYSIPDISELTNPTAESRHDSTHSSCGMPRCSYTLIVAKWVGIYGLTAQYPSSRNAGHLIMRNNTLIMERECVRMSSFGKSGLRS